MGGKAGLTLELVSLIRVFYKGNIHRKTCTKLELENVYRPLFNFGKKPEKLPKHSITSFRNKII